MYLQNINIKIGVTWLVYLLQNNIGKLSLYSFLKVRLSNSLPPYKSKLKEKKVNFSWKQLKKWDIKQNVLYHVYKTIILNIHKFAYFVGSSPIVFSYYTRWQYTSDLLVIQRIIDHIWLHQQFYVTVLPLTMTKDRTIWQSTESSCMTTC